MRSVPRNINDLCRLCLSESDGTCPIFGEELEERSSVPLSFMILACVSVEVSPSDGLPNFICKSCLNDINHWHDFKQKCDLAQATLKEWKNCSPLGPSPEKEIAVKQEPCDVDETVDLSEDSGSVDLMAFDMKQEPEDNEEQFLEYDDDDDDDDGSVMDEFVMESDPLSVSLIENLLRRPVKRERGSNEVLFSHEEDDMVVSALPNLHHSDSAQSLVMREELPKVRKKKYRKRLTLPRKKPRPSIGNPNRPVRSFPCRVCEKTFPYNYLLRRHSATHTRDTNVCSVCRKSFSSKANLERHIQLHGAKQFSCQNCLQDFHSEYLYLAHIGDQVCHRKQEDNSKSMEIFDCYLCKKSFPSRLTLKLHMSDHSQFRCPKCKKCFSGGIALSNHLRSHTTRGFKRYSCRVCLKSFSNIAALASHKKYHYNPKRYSVSKKVIPEKNDESHAITSIPLHKKSPRSAPRGKGIQCKVCRKWVKNQSALERHMTTHTKLKLFSCSICKLSMGYASSVHKHMRVIHGMTIDFKTIKSQISSSVSQESIKSQLPNDKNNSSSGQTERKKCLSAKTFNCTFCHKIFPNRHMQKIHQKLMHMEKKTYKCTICNKVFAFRSYLSRHIKVHAGKTFYNCSVCSKSFADQKTLNNHKGVHTRFKYYTCGMCNKSFNGFKAYDRHQRMHNRSIMYSCKFCSKKFVSKSELHHHKKIHLFKLKIFSCNLCENSYHSSSALSKHKKKHLAQNVPNIAQKLPSRINLSHGNVGTRSPWVCNICKKSFSCLSALRRHKRLHVKGNTVKSDPGIVDPEEDRVCVICSRQFPDHASLVRHKGWHTRRPESLISAKQEPSLNPLYHNEEANETSTHDCSMCSKSFTHTASLRKHFKLHHPGKSEDEMKLPSFKFLNEFKTKPLKASKQSNTCMICSKQFHSKKALITHRGWHSRLANSKKILVSSAVTENVQVKEEPKNFYCSLCNKNFSSVSDFDEHRHFHSQNIASNTTGNTFSEESQGKLFSCDMCSKTFKCEDYLIMHQRMHAGERPFACDMCPQAYHRRANLWKHKKTHLASFQAYSCTVCNKMFSIMEDLTQHMAQHALSQNLFPCGTCGKTFSRLDNLRQHAKCHT